MSLKMKVKAGAVLFLWICILFSAAPSFSQKSDSTKTAAWGKVLSLKEFLPGCKGDRWLAEDKYRHFWGSAFAAGFGFTVLRYWEHVSPREALFLSGGLSFSLGLGKELHDKYARAGCASWKDLTADFLGMVLGMVVYKYL